MDQYDINPEMKKLYEIKQQQRAAAKAYYQNLVYNPYRPINDGAPFDPALFRYTAMSAYHVDFFKPNAKVYFKLFAAAAPVVLYYFYFNHERQKKEELIRSGVVRYEDRPCKYYA